MLHVNLPTLRADLPTVSAKALGGVRELISASKSSICNEMAGA
jgi:hypothetical protein